MLGIKKTTSKAS